MLRSQTFLSPHDHAFDAYSEQDTADKLILPYLEKGFGFPSPASLDYQAQHMTALGDSSQGRYDGLYLHDGFPYAVLEAKRYKHDLTEADVLQARSYATSETFDYPVPFLIISNGREHRFLSALRRSTRLTGNCVMPRSPPHLGKRSRRRSQGR